MKQVAFIWAILCFCLVQGAMAQSLEDVLFMTEELPPYNYTVAGERRGISIEVLDAALAAVGIQMDMSNVEIYPWARVYDSIRWIPMTCGFAAVRTPQREALFKWAGPIVDFTDVCIAKKNRVTIKTTKDLTKYTLCVLRDTSTHQALLALGCSEDSLELSNTMQNALDKVEYGRADIFIGDKRTTFYALQQAGLDIDQYEVCYTFNKNYGYFAFNSQTPDSVVESLRRGIDIIRANGKIDRILKKYQIH